MPAAIIASMVAQASAANLSGGTTWQTTPKQKGRAR